MCFVVLASGLALARQPQLIAALPDRVNADELKALREAISQQQKKFPQQQQIQTLQQ